MRKFCSFTFSPSPFPFSLRSLFLFLSLSLKKFSSYPSCNVSTLRPASRSWMLSWILFCFCIFLGGRFRGQRRRGKKGSDRGEKALKKRENTFQLLSHQVQPLLRLPVPGQAHPGNEDAHPLGEAIELSIGGQEEGERRRRERRERERRGERDGERIRRERHLDLYSPLPLSLRFQKKNTLLSPCPGRSPCRRDRSPGTRAGASSSEMISLFWERRKRLSSRLFSAQGAPPFRCSVSSPPTIQPPIAHVCEVAHHYFEFLLDNLGVPDGPRRGGGRGDAKALRRLRRRWD